MYGITSRRLKTSSQIGPCPQNPDGPTSNSGESQPRLNPLSRRLAWTSEIIAEAEIGIEAAAEGEEAETEVPTALEIGVVV